MSHRPFVGVSLKAYLGFHETMEWTKTLADHVGGHPAVRSGDIEVVVFPSTPFLSSVVELLDSTPISVGAQDVSAFASGAFTGETIASHLAEMGVSYGEIGHAERRDYFSESGETIGRKLRQVVDSGLAPLLCIGEGKNVGVTRGAEECIAQIDDALEFVADHLVGDSLVVAYEPVWAIGAAKPAPEDHVRQMYGRIRHHLDQVLGPQVGRVVYGGSAGPGLLGRISPPLDGLFLGRFAHKVSNIAQVLDEVALISSE